MIRNKVSKLNKTKIELSNGVFFTIDDVYQSWLSRTEIYTAESFVKYVKIKEPERIFVTLEDYEKITNRKSEYATKEDFEAENN